MQQKTQIRSGDMHVPLPRQTIVMRGNKTKWNPQELCAMLMSMRPFMPNVWAKPIALMNTLFHVRVNDVYFDHVADIAYALAQIYWLSEHYQRHAATEAARWMMCYGKQLQESVEAYKQAIAVFAKDLDEFERSHREMPITRECDFILAQEILTEIKDVVRSGLQPLIERMNYEGMLEDGDKIML